MLPTLPSALRDDNATTNATIIIMLGYLAPSVQKADYTALKLLYLLGEWPSSRLFVELREAGSLRCFSILSDTAGCSSLRGIWVRLQKTLRSPWKD